MKTGCPMRVIIQPYDKLRKFGSTEISDDAEKRLKIIDWYKFKSPLYSENKKRNVALTCRHFGISRSYFYFWYSRFKRSNYHLKSLEKESRTPRIYRKVEYNKEIIERIREIRKENSTYGPRKIRKILSKEMKKVPSRATIGRIIQKHKMFYKTGQMEEHKRRALLIERAKGKKRIPFMLRAEKPCEIIEFDMKHITTVCGKLYAMCAIDCFTRRALIYICSRPSSDCARRALEKVIEKFGPEIRIHNDNGSENMGKAAEYLKENNIEQFWARPYKPKDKAFIERFIGTYQREFLDYNYGMHTVKELQELTNKWLEKYENYRPHDSLDLMTPVEFEQEYYKKIA